MGALTVSDAAIWGCEEEEQEMSDQRIISQLVVPVHSPVQQKDITAGKTARVNILASLTLGLRW